MKKLLTIDELSHMLGISKSTLYRWVHYEFIPHIKLGSAVRFDEDAVCKWLKKRENPGRLRLAPDPATMVPPS